MKLIATLFLYILCAFTASAQNDTMPKPRKIKERPEAAYVSIISLIANPAKYDGKRVSLKGYMSAEFEGTALYLSRDDFDHGVTKNAIFLIFNGNYSTYHKEYVSLHGTFINSGGHLGAFSGTLKDVEYITVDSR